MSIQRWDFDVVRMLRDDEGYYVTYADHLAEVERLWGEWLDKSQREEVYDRGRERGYTDAVAACIAAVESLRSARHRYPEIDPSDYSTAFDYAQDVALAALRGVKL